MVARDPWCLMPAQVKPAPQALGTAPERDVRACMFCGQSMTNRHEGFFTHLDTSEDCRTAYQAWLEHLDEDRPGG